MSSLDLSVKQFRDVHVDVMARVVTVSGLEVHLTRTEFDLLMVFVEHQRRALSRAQILNLVWGESWFGDYHHISVHISNLRRKLGDGGRVHPMIQTVHGYGYRFDG